MGKKKTKTSSQETSHAVTTPNNPEWMTSGAQTLNAGIQKLAATDPASTVAPVSALEQQAALGASSLGAGLATAPDNSWFSKMMATPTANASSASLLDNLSAYQSPYRKDVTDAAMADFDADAGRTRASQALAMAGQGAFGGSGAALTASQTEGELARARNSQMSKLLQDMFMNSASLSGQDADRRQQASIANANLAQQDMQSRAQLGLQNAQMQAQYGLDRDANARANVAAQSGLGQQLRSVDQATRSAPATALAQQIEMFSGLPLSLFQGQTVDSSGNRSGTETATGAMAGEIAQLITSLKH